MYSTTAAASLALIQRLHTSHSERYRDDLLGIQAVRQTARQLIGKIGNDKEYFYYLVFVL